MVSRVAEGSSDKWMIMDRQELVTETFNRLLERGAVARSDVDAALAAAGHAPASAEDAEEWCRATGEPTPRERRFGAGLTVRQYAPFQALFHLAPTAASARARAASTYYPPSTPCWRGTTAARRPARRCWPPSSAWRRP